jgi:membrane associated rhomboid family serine protease
VTLDSVIKQPLTVIVYDEMGIQNFIAVYLGTGVVASLTALIFHVLRRNYLYVSLGASGAGSGLMGVYSTLQPE